MPRWLLIVDDPGRESSPGWMDADTPNDAIVDWVGTTFNDAPIYVVPADAVLHFEPSIQTVWQQVVAAEGKADR